MLWFCTNWWCQILVVRWNAVARRGLCEAVTFVVVSSNITTWTWRPRRSPSYHVDLAASSFSFYDEECCSEILCVGNYAIPPAKPVITKSRARDIISQLKSSWRSIQGHLRWRSIAQVSTSYQLLNLSKSINLENQHVSIKSFVAKARNGMSDGLWSHLSCIEITRAVHAMATKAKTVATAEYTEDYRNA